MKKKILIFQTGGTISMPPMGPLGPQAQGPDFVKHVPELKSLAKIDILMADNLDSANVTPSHWSKWLKQIQKVYSKYDGFVITHGTDTMVYTGAAFSFALGAIEKPIVFTGSQRPLGAIRSDARLNLINSVESACKSPGLVSLCFGNKLIRAVNALKLSANDYVAFESFNSPLLAKMGVEYESHWRLLTKAAGQRKNTLNAKVFKLQFNEKVFCFKIFPGISGEILMDTVRAKSCEGLVLEAYGAGNVPDLDHSVLGMIKEARGLKKPVVISSQCPDGKVDLSKYLCGRKAEAAGAISGGSMTTEACVVKLMHGMGIGLEGAALKNYFKANICGEQGENSI